MENEKLFSFPLSSILAVPLESLYLSLENLIIESEEETTWKDRTAQCFKNQISRKIQIFPGYYGELRFFSALWVGEEKRITSKNLIKKLGGEALQERRKINFFRASIPPDQLGLLKDYLDVYCAELDSEFGYLRLGLKIQD